MPVGKHKARLIRAIRNPTLKSVRSALWVGALAVAAFFICIEVLDLITPAPPPAPATASPAPTKGPPPAATPKPPVVTRAPAKVPKVAPSAVPPSAPPAAIAAPPEKVIAKAKPSDAERLAAAPVLLLTGMDSQRDAALQRDGELLDLAIDGKAWSAYRSLLARSIHAALAGIPQGRDLSRFDAVWKEPVLYQAILRWRTLGWFSESEITRLVTDHYSAGMFSWLLHHNQAMEELLVTLHPKNDCGKVLKFLMDVWPLNEKNYEKFFSLAVACAVVFDKPMGVSQVTGKSAAVAESAVDPVKRYLWYVEKDEKCKLAAPVHKSSARDLIWVVCAPVPTSELEWSLEKMRLNRKNWGNAYGMIKYLMKRAVDGYNPYKEYSFAEILKWGGICGDQSYFCVNTARAQGIPAMTIGGETNLGGHAWAGIKADPDQWFTGVGRISGASNGIAGNPQTGEPTSEQEIQLWNDRSHKTHATFIAVWRHFWLADFFAASNRPVDHAATVHLANRIGHSFVETWQALFALMSRQTTITGDPAVPNNLADWKKFVLDLRREFKKNPRMAQLAATAETQFVFPYGTDGEAKHAFLRDRWKIEHEAGEQKDLIATSLKREAELIMQRGGPNAKRDIGNLYERALRDYGGSITGFKMMAQDYFSYCKDDSELALKAAHDIERAFKRVVETGSTNWFRATTEVEIYKMMCGFYRSAGDADHAETLEKRYELLLRRAKRAVAPSTTRAP